MKLGHQFYCLHSLKSNQKYGLFLKKKPPIRVNSREYSSPNETATYSPFTKGTWYPIPTNSMGTQPYTGWALLSNAHTRQECLAHFKLRRRWGTPPASLPLCWEGTP